jgi:predicted amidophosphoribosyltransferase
MSNDCLYCGLQFFETTKFCPNCGRPTEKGFRILPIQKSKFNHLRGEPGEKDGPVRRQGFYSGCSSPLAHKDCLYCGLQFSNTTKFCPNCGRPMETSILKKGAALPQSRASMPVERTLRRRKGHTIGADACLKQVRDEPGPTQHR